MKKVIIIITAVIVVILGTMGFFVVRMKQMVKVINTEYSRITNIDLKGVSNGVYTGSFGDFAVSVNLETTVKDHKITDIKIIKQSSGKGYEARDIVKRILNAQTTHVDAVTGATMSSKCIMIAVNKALQSKPE